MAQTVTTTTEYLSWDAIGSIEWEGNPVTLTTLTDNRVLVLRYDGATYKSSDTSQDAHYIVTRLMLRGIDRSGVSLQHTKRVSKGVTRRIIKMRHLDAQSDWRWTLTLVRQE
jgi:hypothetical protein